MSDVVRETALVEAMKGLLIRLNKELMIFSLNGLFNYIEIDIEESELKIRALIDWQKSRSRKRRDNVTVQYTISDGHYLGVHFEQNRGVRIESIGREGTQLAFAMAKSIRGDLPSGIERIMVAQTALLSFIMSEVLCAENDHGVSLTIDHGCQNFMAWHRVQSLAEMLVNSAKETVVIRVKSPALTKSSGPPQEPRPSLLIDNSSSDASRSSMDTANDAQLALMLQRGELERAVEMGDEVNEVLAPPHSPIDLRHRVEELRRDKQPASFDQLSMITVENCLDAINAQTAVLSSIESEFDGAEDIAYDDIRNDKKARLILEREDTIRLLERLMDCARELAPEGTTTQRLLEMAPPETSEAAALVMRILLLANAPPSVNDENRAIAKILIEAQEFSARDVPYTSDFPLDSAWLRQFDPQGKLETQEMGQRGHCLYLSFLRSRFGTVDQDSLRVGQRLLRYQVVQFFNECNRENAHPLIDEKTFGSIGRVTDDRILFNIRHCSEWAEDEALGALCSLYRCKIFLATLHRRQFKSPSLDCFSRGPYMENHDELENAPIALAYYEGLHFRALRLAAKIERAPVMTSSSLIDTSQSKSMNRAYCRAAKSSGLDSKESDATPVDSDSTTPQSLTPSTSGLVSPVSNESIADKDVDEILLDDKTLMSPVGVVASATASAAFAKQLFVTGGESAAAMAQLAIRAARKDVFSSFDAEIVPRATKFYKAAIDAARGDAVDSSTPVGSGLVSTTLHLAKNVAAAARASNAAFATDSLEVIKFARAALKATTAVKQSAKEALDAVTVAAREPQSLSAAALAVTKTKAAAAAAATLAKKTAAVVNVATIAADISNSTRNSSPSMGASAVPTEESFATVSPLGDKGKRAFNELKKEMKKSLASDALIGEAEKLLVSYDLAKVAYSVVMGPDAVDMVAASIKASDDDNGRRVIGATLSKLDWRLKKFLQLLGLESSYSPASSLTVSAALDKFRDVTALNYDAVSDTAVALLTASEARIEADKAAAAAAAAAAASLSAAVTAAIATAVNASRTAQASAHRANQARQVSGIMTFANVKDAAALSAEHRATADHAAVAAKAAARELSDAVLAALTESSTSPLNGSGIAPVVDTIAAMVGASTVASYAAADAATAAAVGESLAVNEASSDFQSIYGGNFTTADVARFAQKRGFSRVILLVGSPLARVKGKQSRAHAIDSLSRASRHEELKHAHEAAKAFLSEASALVAQHRDEFNRGHGSASTLHDAELAVENAQQAYHMAQDALFEQGNFFLKINKAMNYVLTCHRFTSADSQRRRAVKATLRLIAIRDRSMWLRIVEWLFSSEIARCLRGNPEALVLHVCGPEGREADAAIIAINKQWQELEVDALPILMERDADLISAHHVDMHQLHGLRRAEPPPLRLRSSPFVKLIIGDDRDLLLCALADYVLRGLNGELVDRRKLLTALNVSQDDLDVIQLNGGNDFAGNVQNIGPATIKKALCEAQDTVLATDSIRAAQEELVVWRNWSAQGSPTTHDEDEQYLRVSSMKRFFSAHLFANETNQLTLRSIEAMRPLHWHLLAKQQLASVPQYLRVNDLTLHVVTDAPLIPLPLLDREIAARVALGVSQPLKHTLAEREGGEAANALRGKRQRKQLLSTDDEAKSLLRGFITAKESDSLKALRMTLIQGIAANEKKRRELNKTVVIPENSLVKEFLPMLLLKDQLSESLTIERSAGDFLQLDTRDQYRLRLLASPFVEDDAPLDFLSLLMYQYLVTDLLQFKMFWSKRQFHLRSPGNYALETRPHCNAPWQQSPIKVNVKYGRPTFTKLSGRPLTNEMLNALESNNEGIIDQLIGEPLKRWWSRNDTKSFQLFRDLKITNSTPGILFIAQQSYDDYNNMRPVSLVIREHVNEYNKLNVVSLPSNAAVELFVNEKNRFFWFKCTNSDQFEISSEFGDAQLKCAPNAKASVVKNELPSKKFIANQLSNWEYGNGASLSPIQLFTGMKCIDLFEAEGGSEARSQGYPLKALKLVKGQDKHVCNGCKVKADTKEQVDQHLVKVRESGNAQADRHEYGGILSDDRVELCRVRSDLTEQVMLSLRIHDTTMNLVSRLGDCIHESRKIVRVEFEKSIALQLGLITQATNATEKEAAIKAASKFLQKILDSFPSELTRFAKKESVGMLISGDILQLLRPAINQYTSCLKTATSKAVLAVTQSIIYAVANFKSIRLMKSVRDAVLNHFSSAVAKEAAEAEAAEAGQEVEAIETSQKKPQSMLLMNNDQLIKALYLSRLSEEEALLQIDFVRNFPEYFMTARENSTRIGSIVFSERIVETAGFRSESEKLLFIQSAGISLGAKHSPMATASTKKLTHFVSINGEVLKLIMNKVKIGIRYEMRENQFGQQFQEQPIPVLVELSAARHKKTSNSIHLDNVPSIAVWHAIPGYRRLYEEFKSSGNPRILVNDLKMNLSDAHVPCVNTEQWKFPVVTERNATPSATMCIRSLPLDRQIEFMTILEIRMNIEAIGGAATILKGSVQKEEDLKAIQNTFKESPQGKKVRGLLKYELLQRPEFKIDLSQPAAIGEIADHFYDFLGNQMDVLSPSRIKGGLRVHGGIDMTMTLMSTPDETLREIVKMTLDPGIRMILSELVTVYERDGSANPILLPQADAQRIREAIGQVAETVRCAESQPKSSPNDDDFGEAYYSELDTHFEDRIKEALIRQEAGAAAHRSLDSADAGPLAEEAAVDRIAQQGSISRVDKMRAQRKLAKDRRDGFLRQNRRAANLMAKQVLLTMDWINSQRPESKRITKAPLISVGDGCGAKNWSYAKGHSRTALSSPAGLMRALSTYMTVLSTDEWGSSAFCSADDCGERLIDVKGKPHYHVCPNPRCGMFNKTVEHDQTSTFALTHGDDSFFRLQYRPQHQTRGHIPPSERKSARVAVSSSSTSNTAANSTTKKKTTKKKAVVAKRKKTESEEIQPSKRR